VDLAGTLRAWWESYLEMRPPWHVALSALDQMLGELDQTAAVH
jgi:hypothetical protein